ncbi:hypothetical protein B0J18DRAFT_460251 [Chaetomium sp. MPI-SDFR-AT-0129]|nr:hypothetical protein B0J18DRAFT_460251 [Chaetomium sp. MPI-SDFR-AT-0129]
MAYLNDRASYCANGYPPARPPSQNAQPEYNPQKEQRTALSVLEMLNPPPRCQLRRADTTPPSGAASPGNGAWSPSGGSTSPNNYTYSTSSPAVEWKDHRPAARGNDPTPTRYHNEPRAWLPPIVAPAEGPMTGGYGGHGSHPPSRASGHHHLPGQGHGGRSHASTASFSSGVYFGTLGSERDVSTPSTRDGSEGPSSPSSSSTIVASKSRQNFTPAQIKTFIDAAKAKILENDDRCKFKREEMERIAAEANVTLKQVETWYTNHRRRGFPQQTVDVLACEIQRVGHRRRELVHKAEQLRQQAGADANDPDAAESTPEGAAARATQLEAMHLEARLTELEGWKREAVQRLANFGTRSAAR